jgi:hypothetical protein
VERDVCTKANLILLIKTHLRQHAGLKIWDALEIPDDGLIHEDQLKICLSEFMIM